MDSHLVLDGNRGYEVPASENKVTNKEKFIMKSLFIVLILMIHLGAFAQDEAIPKKNYLKINIDKPVFTSQDYSQDLTGSSGIKLDGSLEGDYKIFIPDITFGFFIEEDVALEFNFSYQSKEIDNFKSSSGNNIPVDYEMNRKIFGVGLRGTKPFTESGNLYYDASIRAIYVLVDAEDKANNLEIDGGGFGLDSVLGLRLMSTTGVTALNGGIRTTQIFKHDLDGPKNYKGDTSELLVNIYIGVEKIF